LPKFPKEIEDYREPFIGGGSVAIEFTKQFPDASVWVNDLYEPLYNFWVQLQGEGDALRNVLIELKSGHDTEDKARELFNTCKEIINDEKQDSLHRAASFYVVNKCSFSGLTESSSFSRQASVSNFSVKGIENLPLYGELIKNWKITNLSYEHMLDGTPETFIYLDPPYDIKDNLYGKKGEMHKKFDHELFAKRMNFTPCKSLISYNSSLFVKSRFEDWGASTYELTYTMRSVGDYMDDQKDRAELLLFNYEV
jgi:DNA adenine methylase